MTRGLHYMRVLEDEVIALSRANRRRMLPVWLAMAPIWFGGCLAALDVYCPRAPVPFVAGEMR